MKSGTLAQVHRKGIKAGYHDQCFKEAELSSKELRLWTSIDTILKDADDPFHQCITADNAKWGGRGRGDSNVPTELRAFVHV